MPRNSVMAESHDLKLVILHISCVKSIKAVNGLMWYIIKKKIQSQYQTATDLENTAMKNPYIC